MNNRGRIRLTYSISTGVFALLLLLDGIGGVTRSQAGVDVLQHLGYPLYLMTILGVMKILAAAAIVQTRFAVLKEWAYAGFAFNCLGAYASRMAVGDTGMDLVFPWIFLLIGAVPYWLWKRSTVDRHHSAGRRAVSGLNLEGL